MPYDDGLQGFPVHGSDRLNDGGSTFGIVADGHPRQGAEHVRNGTRRGSCRRRLTAPYFNRSSRYCTARSSTSSFPARRPARVGATSTSGVSPTLWSWRPSACRTSWPVNITLIPPG